MMIRTLSALAIASAMIALPASAESIRVSTQGKSVEQVKLEVRKAAVQLCARETMTATFQMDEMRSCVKHTMRTTLAQSANPALQLASN